jgi:hypothetical protein
MATHDQGARLLVSAGVAFTDPEAGINDTISRSGATPPLTGTLPTADLPGSRATPAILGAGIHLLAFVIAAGTRPLRAIRTR